MLYRTTKPQLLQKRVKLKIWRENEFFNLNKLLTGFKKQKIKKIQRKFI